MNPDELPERDTFQISYGDRRYRVTLTGKLATRAALKYQVLADCAYALSEYHGKVHRGQQREAQVRELLYRMASRYPEVARDPDFNHYVTNGEVRHD